MMRMVHLDVDDFMYYVVLLVVQLYCVSLLFIQSELFKKSALEKELFTMNILMKQQEAQYELTRDNIDMINRKCHDLKHQVQALRSVAAVSYTHLDVYKRQIWYHNKLILIEHKRKQQRS